MGVEQYYAVSVIVDQEKHPDFNISDEDREEFVKTLPQPETTNSLSKWRFYRCWKGGYHDSVKEEKKYRYYDFGAKIYHYFDIEIDDEDISKRINAFVENMIGIKNISSQVQKDYETVPDMEPLHKDGIVILKSDYLFHGTVIQ